MLLILVMMHFDFGCCLAIYWLIYFDCLDDWYCDVWWLFLVSPLFNLIGSFGIDEIDRCLDSSEKIEVSLLAIWFWGFCKEKSVLWGVFTFTEKFPTKILIMSFLVLFSSERCWTNLSFIELILLDCSLFDDLKTASRSSISFLKNVLMEKSRISSALFLYDKNKHIRTDFNRSTRFICLGI